VPLSDLVAGHVAPDLYAIAEKQRELDLLEDVTACHKVTPLVASQVVPQLARLTISMTVF